uniref:Predicted protein n=1 Tax=Hordeum vulgare subsp. vulgare TaxID=112509 RepID=F2E680_HORVV|nr:predicted protein [Hordeum vulgare subsp. vulgare]
MTARGAITYREYKLDADEIYSGGLHELPEPAAIRINSSVHGPMDFAALGTNIFVALNLRYYFDDGDAPATIVYNTKTEALGVGPRLLSGIPAFWAAMAAGEKLYALTTEVLSLQALSSAPTNNTWNLRGGDEMNWLWNSEPSLPPCSGLDVVAYALHPDGRTIFMSTASVTHCFDTSNGLWKELGDWVLPFRGQAYFDHSLDAWVGIYHKGEGYVCCCPVASRSAIAKRPPDCRMLKEKLFGHNNDKPWICGGRYMDATLTYMGYNRFCLVENILRHEKAVNSMLHVTLFSLKYDCVGELQSRLKFGHAPGHIQCPRTPCCSLMQHSGCN